MKILDQVKYLTAQPMTTSFNGPVHQITRMLGFSVQAVWTETVATLSGTLKVQASNDGVTWFDTSNTTPVSGSGSFLFNITSVFYKYFRVVYTATSGQGTVTVITHAKE